MVALWAASRAAPWVSQKVAPKANPLAAAWAVPLAQRKAETTVSLLAASWAETWVDKREGWWVAYSDEMKAACSAAKRVDQRAVC